MIDDSGFRAARLLYPVGADLVWLYHTVLHSNVKYCTTVNTAGYMVRGTCEENSD